MGLDVYAGPLTRYYTRNWQTVAQSIGAVLVFSDGEPEPVSADDARDVIVAWRERLNLNVEKFRHLQLAWDENPVGEYFTDKPDFEGWFALQLWAAYLDQPPSKRPQSKINQQFLENDPVYQEALQTNPRNPLLSTLQCELFVPSAHSFIFEAELPNGREAWIGTTAALKAVLDKIDQQSWNATPDELIGWLSDGLPADVFVGEEKRTWIDRLTQKKPKYIFEYRGADDRMQHAAKFAFAVFRKASEFSHGRNVPIILDY